MEWFGEKMLPRGLTELAYEIVPGWISPRLTIVTLPKKEYKYLRGEMSYHNGNYIIKIYPTVILADFISGIGVTSFQNWVSFLKMFLHELGHVMTYDKYKHISIKEYKENINCYEYIENLANQWCDITLSKIASRDSRLGQPIGWIGGLPGIYLKRSNDLAKKNLYNSSFSPFEMNRIDGYRAYRCDGQIKLLDVVKKLCTEYEIPWDYHGNGLTRKNRITRIIKKINSDLGIQRFYTDKAGRKHIFFNHGEADSVLNQTRNWLENEGANILKELQKEEIEKQHGERKIKKKHSGNLAYSFNDLH